MNTPFNLAALFFAVWASEDWALCAARWEKATGPHGKRLSLYARATAVVVYDRVLNGRVK